MFWHKKSRYFAYMVDKCGSHTIAPMDGRTWAIIIDDYKTIVKRNPANTYKDKAGSGEEMTVFRSGDDIPEDTFELYIANRHSLLDIDDYYLDSSAMKAEKPDDQTLEKIREITASIHTMMNAYYKKAK